MKIKDNSKIVRTLPARYESKNYIYYYLKGHHIVFQIIRRKAYLIMECQDEEIRDDEAYYFHFDDIHKRVIRDVIYQQQVINHEVYYPKSFSFEAVVQKALIWQPVSKNNRYAQSGRMDAGRKFQGTVKF
ncbi:MAG: hypothetical protein ACLU99_00655 [Alphaproteobacteria bacterium]